MKGWTKKTMKILTKSTLSTNSVNWMKKVNILGGSWASMFINFYFSRISWWVKLKNVKKLCQDTENYLVTKDQMVGLGCLFVCTFGDYLIPILIAAHTAKNLNFGDGPEDEGNEKQGTIEFNPFFGPKI